MTISKHFILLMGLLCCALGFIFMCVATELVDHHGRWSSDSPLKDAIYSFAIGLALVVAGITNLLVSTGSRLS